MSGVLAVGCWGVIGGLLVYALSCDVRRWFEDRRDAQASRRLAQSRLVERARAAEWDDAEWLAGIGARWQ